MVNRTLLLVLISCLAACAAGQGGVDPTRCLVQTNNTSVVAGQRVILYVSFRDNSSSPVAYNDALLDVSCSPSAAACVDVPFRLQQAQDQVALLVSPATATKNALNVSGIWVNITYAGQSLAGAPVWINVTAQTLLAAAYSFAVQGTIQVTPGAGTVLASMAGLSDMFGNAINPALLVNNVSMVMTLIPYSYVWKVPPSFSSVRANATLSSNGTMLLFAVPTSVRTAGDYRWGLECVTPTGDIQAQRILTLSNTTVREATVNVKAGAVVLTETVAVVSNPGPITAGTVVNATVTLFDGSGNAAPFARSSIGVAAYLTGVGNVGCLATMLTTLDQQYSYNFAMNCTRSGSLTVRGLVNGLPRGTGAALTVTTTTWQLSATQLLTTWPNTTLTAGAPLSMLRVWVYDVFNNTISNAADAVALLVTPQDSAPSLTAGVTPAAGGAYATTQVLYAAGTYRIQVMLNGSTVAAPQASINITVVPSDTVDAYWSYAYGECLVTTPSVTPMVTAGDVQRVTVVARDPWGNPHTATSPGFQLDAGFVSACALYNTSSSGGRTIITFAVTTAGNYTLTVLGPSGLAVDEVYRGPLLVVPGALSPNQTLVNNSCTSPSSSGVCCNITAAPQDQYNNTIKDDVQLQGLRLLHGIPPVADQVSLDPVMGLNYTISFSVCLWEVGDHPLSLLSLAGVTVPLQTITVTPSATDGRQVVISGTASRWRTGQTVVLGLSPHDAFGNPTVLDPQSLQVEVFPPCNCLVTYSSGSGNLLLSSLAPGTYFLYLAVAGAPLDQYPVTLSISS